MNFYAVIIGTEILNNRREDKHFSFLSSELAKYGHELFASFIIKDDVSLITNTYEMIKADEDAVIFSFGGIGSTPDDLTRKISAKVFTSSPLVTHKQFLADIIERFENKAYPHRIHMADLPLNANLLYNPVNNMSGYSLNNRYFFVPGFPSMAHPMIAAVIKTHFSKFDTKYRKTLLAHTSEETLITLMQTLPSSIELSCLPMFVDNKPNVELSLSGTNKVDIEYYFKMFEDELNKKNIYYN
ncbi:MAG: molybdopterin-binding protein [Campylobacterota bacterium]|nr:molybdopterin-binding protein [Campylobacterota bacterium]